MRTTIDATSSTTPPASVVHAGDLAGRVESLVEHWASVEVPRSVVPAHLLRQSVEIEDPAT